MEDNSNICEDFLLLSDDIRIENLADSFNGLSCSAIETVLNKAAIVMTSEGKVKLTWTAL